MIISKILKIILILLIYSKIYAKESICLHKVQKNENLINILRTYKNYPVYGENGSLKETLRLNKLTSQDPNLIYPNEILKIKNLNYNAKNQSNIISYVVNKQDTLFSILKKLKHFHNLDLQTALNETLKLNPQILNHESKGNLIYPNEVIYIKIQNIEFCMKNFETINNLEKSNLNDFHSKITNESKLEAENKNENKDESKEINEEKVLDIHSKFYAGLMQTYERLDIYDRLNNSNATLISHVAYGANFGWSQYFTNDFYANINGRIQSISFKPFTNINLMTNKVNIGNFEASLNYNFLDYFNLGIVGQNRYFVYSRSSAVTNIGSSNNISQYNLYLDPVQQYGLGGRLYAMLDLPYELNLNSHLMFLHFYPTNTNTYAVSRWNLFEYGINLNKSINIINFYLEINYTYGQQTTSLTNQKLQMLDGIIGVSIEFGKKVQKE
ncbi:LysM peptidoglycan-binding domain-containing protein [Pigmentibacter sp. JX0631]|uniref:LysM peptidoglycan-binding domain-containing protein n=1 Tax=Pigmentibacter sp. JX0631 TaxID=2976982 RepID=UPI002468F8BF|nr:LysM peptidoglycan-binding domain-containing protein [Pigmentibacter sp. JX0631]WGL59998.1 LysM peptidoglycan-binding domain-containing protein [Pigmentibacter sp. JX0631]